EIRRSRIPLVLARSCALAVCQHDRIWWSVQALSLHGRVGWGGCGNDSPHLLNLPRIRFSGKRVVGRIPKRGLDWRSVPLSNRMGRRCVEYEPNGGRYKFFRGEKSV